MDAEPRWGTVSTAWAEPGRNPTINANPAEVMINFLKEEEMDLLLSICYSILRVHLDVPSGLAPFTVGAIYRAKREKTVHYILCRAGSHHLRAQFMLNLTPGSPLAFVPVGLSATTLLTVLTGLIPLT